MRTGRTVAALLLTLTSIAAACGAPSPDPNDSPVPSAAPAGGNVGSRETARFDELDDWYGSFHDVSNETPTGRGTLLRAELVAASASVRVYRSMYSSTSVDGETPLAVTGTIWVPGDLGDSAGAPVLAWAPGFNGIGDFCAWSHRAVDPTQDYQDLLPRLVDDGWVVATTDYEGHGTRDLFLDAVGESSTHSLLDAARAAMDLLGPAVSNRVAIAGHSLGGVAAAQSLLYASAYAEGLDLLGAVSIEGVGDFELLAASAPGPDDIGVLGTIRNARSWPAAYPELHAEDVLTPYGIELLNSVNERGCVWFHALDEARALDVTQVSWMDVEPWASRIRAQTVTAAPFPVFYVVAGDSPLAEPIRTVAERLCQTADHVAYTVYPDTDHNSVIMAAYTQWAGWLMQRVESQPFDGCGF
jgi:acetyl esterase/lipase